MFLQEKGKRMAINRFLLLLFLLHRPTQCTVQCDDPTAVIIIFSGRPPSDIDVRPADRPTTYVVNTNKTKVAGADWSDDK